MMKIYLKPVICMMMFVLCHTKANAGLQPNELQSVKTLPQVSISDQYLKMPFLESNREVMIIKNQDFEAHNIQQPIDLLKYIADIEVVERGPNGAQADIKMSGGTFEQVLILINGHKMMDAQTGHHLMNLPFSMDQIARVEILKGAAARIYGVNSLVGAINFIVNEYNENQISAQLGWGSNFEKNEDERIYQQINAQISGQWRSNKTHHFISSAYHKGNGYRYNTANEQAKLFYAINASLGASIKMESFVSGIYNKFGANGFYAPPNDLESEEKVNTAVAGTTMNMDLGRYWKSQLMGSYRFNQDDYIFVKTTPDLYRNLHDNHLLQLNWNHLHSFKTIQLKWGLSFEQHWLRSSNLGDRNRNNQGVFLDMMPQWDFPIKLNGGFYLNYNTDWGWKWLPGIDASYALNSNMSIYGAWTTGQRMPTYTDLYYVGPSNIGNPELKPEYSQQMELGWKYAKNTSQLSMSIFYRNVFDLIDWVKEDIQDPWMPDNFGQINTLGINLHASWNHNIGNHWNLNWVPSMTFLKSDAQEFEQLISNYQLEHLKFKWAFMGSISYKNFSFSPAYRFEVRQSNQNLHILDIHLNYQYETAKIYVGIKNVGNVKQIDHFSIPLVGRWLDMGVKWTLH